jgi:HAD superfamily hydrolase (TIGR01509 family)
MGTRTQNDGLPQLKGAFELVIFDCDGVLIDSETISCSTVVSIMARHGVSCDLPEVLARFLGRSANAVTDHYVRMAKRPLPLYFVDEWRAQLFEAFSRDLTPIEGTREAIEALGVPYCLASSSDEERIELTLRKTALWDLFEGRIFSTTMVANGKPAPDVFLFAASAFGVVPQRCLVVEDSVNGITAAKAARMTAYGFTAGSHFAVMDQTHELLGAGADCIIGSMKELQARLAS